MLDYKLKRFGLFGSFVRNEHTEDSDLDILIEMGEPLGSNFFDLKSELASAFNREIDLATHNALHPALKESILKEVVYP